MLFILHYSYSDERFWGSSWIGGQKRQPSLKRVTYPTMMKLVTLIPYLKEIQKIYKSCDTPFEYCRHQYFLPEITKFSYIKKYRYRFYFDTLFLILLTFLSLERFFNKHGSNFDNVSKNDYSKLL